MPSLRRKGRVNSPGKNDETSGPEIELSELASVIAQAIAGAKCKLDEDAIAVAAHYKSDPTLRFFTPPLFAITEVRVAIKFTVAHAELSRPAAGRKLRGHLRVYVDVRSLRDIAPHLVSEIELRITPELTRSESTEKKTVSPE